MDPLEEIEDLVGFERRGPGTDAERRAAGHLARRLEDLDRQATIEPTRVWPSYALAHALNSVLALLASVVSVSAPRVGFALALVAVVSTLGDLTGRLYLARRLTGRRASQNVVSTAVSDRPGTLILVAHYDAARTGLVFDPRILGRGAALGARLNRPLGAFEPLFWSMVAVTVCAALRVNGIDALWLSAVQFPPTVALVIGVALLLNIAVSPIGPGAGDNASGVATVLRLAGRYGRGALEHYDVWVLLTGAEESLLLGMHEWMKRHRRELDPERTVFLNIDNVGHGTVRYLTKEGFVFARPYHPRLVGMCREIAEEDAERRFAARGYASRFATDALVARRAGYPAITVTCLNAIDYAPHYHQMTDTPGNVEPEALDRAYEFCAALIERLDERVGPELSSAERMPSSA